MTTRTASLLSFCAVVATFVIVAGRTALAASTLGAPTWKLEPIAGKSQIRITISTTELKNEVLTEVTCYVKFGKHEETFKISGLEVMPGQSISRDFEHKFGAKAKPVGIKMDFATDPLGKHYLNEHTAKDGELEDALTKRTGTVKPEK